MFDTLTQPCRTGTGVNGRVPGMQIIAGAGGFTAPPEGGRFYLEHLRVPNLSVGTYSVPVGGADTQRPHAEDEIYVVTAGRARFVAEDGQAQVEPGTVIFVPAGEDHRFIDVTEDLAVLVIFGPAEGSAA